MDERIKDLENALTDSRMAGLRIWHRADRWKKALMKISQESTDDNIRIFAAEALKAI